jgi:hypothetical protein
MSIKGSLFAETETFNSVFRFPQNNGSANLTSLSQKKKHMEN